MIKILLGRPHTSRLIFSFRPGMPWVLFGSVWRWRDRRWRPVEKKKVLKKTRIPKMCPPYKKPCKKLNRHRLLRKQILTPMKLLQDGQSRADRGHLHGNSAFRDLCSNILGDEEVSGPPCPALLLNWPGDLRRADPVLPFNAKISSLLTVYAGQGTQTWSRPGLASS